MSSLSSRAVPSLLCVGCLFLLVGPAAGGASAVGASSPTVAGADGPTATGASEPAGVERPGVERASVERAGIGDSCRYDRDPDLPDERAWTETFADPLVNDSLDAWDGGHSAPVGARGDCSLVVADGDSATLTAATVNATDGVVAGTLDLGENGSLRLVAAGGNESGLVLENDGPDYAASAVARAGNRSTDLALPSGRFFEFAVGLDANGTARVAVWEPGGRWDGTWDARFEPATTTESWRVRLRGEAFLDGLAIGVSGPVEARSDSGPTTSGAEADDGDDWPGPGTRPGAIDGGDEPREPDGGGSDSDAGTAVVGLFLIGVGAIGVRYAYGLTRFNEQLDAIGSTTSASAVEPADWNVALTRIVSGLVAAAGLFMLALAIL